MGTLLPNTQDRETRGFFEAAAEGRLVYRACNACDHALHPPTAHCPYCGSWDTVWRGAAGTGTLHTWTVVRHRVHPAFSTPYTLVVVQLDDAPEVRLMGRIEGEAALKPGMRMQVWFERLGGGVTLPQWKPVQ